MKNKLFPIKYQALMYQYLQASILINKNIHIGPMKWELKTQTFILGSRKGIFIFNINYTSFLFKRALFFLTKLAKWGGSHILFFKSKNEYYRNIVKEKLFQRAKINILSKNKWIGGFITNYRYVYKRKPSTFPLIHLLRPASVIIFAAPIMDGEAAIRDSLRGKTPLIAMVNANQINYGDRIAYPVPGNDSSFLARFFFAYTCIASFIFGKFLDLKHEYRNLLLRVYKKYINDNKETFLFVYKQIKMSSLLNYLQNKSKKEWRLRNFFNFIFKCLKIYPKFYRYSSLRIRRRKYRKRNKKKYKNLRFSVFLKDAYRKRKRFSDRFKSLYIRFKNNALFLNMYRQPINISQKKPVSIKTNLFNIKIKSINNVNRLFYIRMPQNNLFYYFFKVQKKKELDFFKNRFFLKKKFLSYFVKFFKNILIYKKFKVSEIFRFLFVNFYAHEDKHYNLMKIFDILQRFEPNLFLSEIKHRRILPYSKDTLKAREKRKRAKGVYTDDLLDGIYNFTRTKLLKYKFDFHNAPVSNLFHFKETRENLNNYTSLFLNYYGYNNLKIRFKYAKRLKNKYYPNELSKL